MKMSRVGPLGGVKTGPAAVAGFLPTPARPARRGRQSNGLVHVRMLSGMLVAALAVGVCEAKGGKSARSGFGTFGTGFGTGGSGSSTGSQGHPGSGTGSGHPLLPLILGSVGGLLGLICVIGGVRACLESANRRQASSAGDVESGVTSTASSASGATSPNGGAHVLVANPDGSVSLAPLPPEPAEPSAS